MLHFASSQCLHSLKFLAMRWIFRDPVNIEFGKSLFPQFLKLEKEGVSAQSYIFRGVGSAEECTYNISLIPTCTCKRSTSKCFLSTINSFLLFTVQPKATHISVCTHQHRSKLFAVRAHCSKQVHDEASSAPSQNV